MLIYARIIGRAAHLRFDPANRLFGMGQGRRYSPSSTQGTILASLDLPVIAGNRPIQILILIEPEALAIHEQAVHSEQRDA